MSNSQEGQSSLQTTRVSKDTAGAVGALGGSGVFVVWSKDIAILFKALFEGLGLTGEALASATDISTDALVIVGSGIAAYFASKFSKK